MDGKDISRELTRNPEERRRRRRFCRRLDDIIKMGIQQREWEGRDCPSLVEDWKKWWSTVKFRVQ